MNILVIGSGGREHTLVWKIKQSPRVKKIFCAPGNGGIARDAVCVDIAVEDIAGLVAFVKKEQIDLTVVGPEIPLVAGLTDALLKDGHKVFGPSRRAAALEGSKVFAKEFMTRHGIPTASYKVFDQPEQAIAYVQSVTYPKVIKADGLAAGKGVIICQNKADALQAIDDIMVRKVFGEAGHRIIVEECLQGPEASILAICDGKDFVVLEAAQDHKRIFDNDQGPNTGGMGAYCPANVVTPEILAAIKTRVLSPAVAGMVKEGTPFKGVLYAGLMLTGNGPMTLEFNVRFGDPETQAVLPRLKSDLIDVMLASCEGRLSQTQLRWDPRPCVCVVMASGGYPGAYGKNKVISGLEQAARLPDTFVFHAGTKIANGQTVTSGGRVLGVTALGEDLKDAITNVYRAVEGIRFDGVHFRRDIGAKAL